MWADGYKSPAITVPFRFETEGEWLEAMAQRFEQLKKSSTAEH
jgi:hypothetical protein